VSSKAWEVHYPVVQLGIGQELRPITPSDIKNINSEAGTATITLNGRIFCDIADLAEDSDADITQVTIATPKFGEADGFNSMTVPLSISTQIPLEEYLPFDSNNIPTGIEQIQHPYIGFFEVDVPLQLIEGTTTILVQATNIIGNQGYDSISITTDTSRARIVEVQNNQGTERGLFKPVWMQIEDSFLTTENIETTRVNVFGERRPIVKRGDNYYADRAFIQIARPLPDNITAANIRDVELAPEPTEQLAIYESAVEDRTTPPVTEQLNWSYTAAKLEVPNNYKYAAGTTIALPWYSTLLNQGYKINDKSDIKVLRDELNNFFTTDEIDVNIEVLGFAEIEPRQGRNGVEIYLRLNKDAHIKTLKQLEITFSKGNERTISRGAFFRVVPLKTIIVAIDGLAFQSANQVIDIPNSNFNQIFANAVQDRDGTTGEPKPALAALPTITWANWPGVFSGQPPSEHGIQGNSFFPREMLSGDLRFPVVSAGQSFEGRIDIRQQIGVVAGFVSPPSRETGLT